jgi:hypothetical protein
VMADSLELILRVCPASGDDARELAKLVGWLRGELLDLDVQGVDRLPGGARPVHAKGSADVAGLLLVRLDQKALKVVQAKLTDWVAQSDRMVEISAAGNTLILRPPTRKEKVIDGSLAADAEVSQVRPEGEAEAVIELTPFIDPNRESPTMEPGKVLVPLRDRGNLPLIREGGDLSRQKWLTEVLLDQEARRTAAFVFISSLLGGGLAVLLWMAVLAVVKHYHRFSISTNYPVHRVYRGIVRYLINVTPHPGSPHILLVYTVYLAVLPVLFAVVFMHLKVGSTKLIVAAVACVTFMAAPFIIAVTSVRLGSTDCGSWNYPEPNPSPECYNALTNFFRIAFAVGIVGLAIPIIYLIRGRRKTGSPLQVLVALTSGVMRALILISNLARRQARDGRDVATDQPRPADVDKYLLPHEQKVITVRRHPAVLIGPSVLALDGLLVAGVLTATIQYGNGSLIAVVWIVCLILFARMIWKAIDWASTFFVVTSQRMLLVSGVVIRKVAMLPLMKVTDMSFHRSSTGRLLGFGQFIIESAGQDQAFTMVDHIPYPEQLYLEICALIFPRTDSSATD